MNSPAEIPFLSFIHLDRTQSTPLYLQVAQQLIIAIQRGYLVLGSKLPGSRRLGQLLQINRQTVVSVYQELEAQGWIETVPNKGTFVINNSLERKENKLHSPNILFAQYPEKTGFHFAVSNILNSPYEYSTCVNQFNDGTPDIRLTQFDQISNLYSASIKRKNNRRSIEKYSHEGSIYFREQLSNYLNYSRGLHISKNNLLVTRSTEMSLYILSKLLLQPNDIILVATLSNFTANMIFQDAGAKVLTVPLDHQGICTEAIRSKSKQQRVRAVYITPHHHYPTTVTLSAERRIELLQLAKEYGFIIIEDDYDYDFQYEKGIAMPMASADTEGMVIYIGTFGKPMAPTFRAGFIVAPENLTSELYKYIALIDRQGDLFMEQVLGEMIEEGDIHRFLKKSLKIYRERRDYFCQLITEFFGEDITFQKPTGGLAIWTQWNKPLSLYRLADVCRQEDLFIPKNILYQNRSLTAIRLGFGHLNNGEMESCLSKLKQGLLKLEINE